MIRVCMLFALGLATLPVAGQEVPLRPSDFAYGVTVLTSADSPLHSVALPRAAYESLTRDDLGDLRVFNARGEAVPYALRRPEEPKAATEWTTLPLFPVRSSEHHGSRARKRTVPAHHNVRLPVRFHRTAAVRRAGAE